MPCMIVALPDVQMALGPTQSLIPRYWGSYLGLNWWGHNTNHSSQSSADTMNEYAVSVP